MIDASIAYNFGCNKGQIELRLMPNSSRPDERNATQRRLTGELKLVPKKTVATNYCTIIEIVIKHAN